MLSPGRGTSYVDKHQADPQVNAKPKRHACAAHPLPAYFDLPLVGIGLISTTGAWLEANDKLCEILGYGREELLRRSWSELTHAADLPQSSAAFDDVLAGRRFSYTIEKRYIRKDGRVVPATVSATRVRGEGRGAGQVVCIVQDVSEGRAAASGETHHRSISESMQDVYYRTDAEGRILTVSPTVRTATGYDPAELIGRLAADIYVDARQRVGLLAELHRSGFVRDYDIKLRAADGRALDFAVCARMLPDENGQGPKIEGVLHDITDRKRMLRELQESEERFRAIADYTYSWESWFGPDGRVLWLNPAVERMTGYFASECLAMSDYPLPIILRSDRRRVRKALEDAAAGGSAGCFTFRIRNKDASVRWMAMSYQPIFGSTGRSMGFRTSILDISDAKIAERQLRRRERMLNNLTENIPGVVYLCRNDSQYTMAYLNKEIERLTGVPADELLSGRTQFLDLCHPDDVPMIHREVDAAVHARRPFLISYRMQSPDGDWRWVEERGQAVLDEAGGIEYLQGTIFDITERRAAEQQRREYSAKLKAANFELEVQKQQLKAQQLDLLKQNEEMEVLTAQLGKTNAELALLTRIDPLTRVLNRRAWYEAAEQHHDRYQRYGAGYSVLMIDVDQFKSFNDTEGHQAGDECLVRIAQSMMSTCRSPDYVGRYGGEEFVVLAPETDLEGASELAERIRQAVYDLNIPHRGSTVADFVTVSIGVAFCADGPWEAVVKRADDALYGAKNAGRNRVAVDLPTARGKAGAPGPATPYWSSAEPTATDQATSRFQSLERFARILPHQVAAIQGALQERDYRLLASLAAQLRQSAEGCASKPLLELAEAVQKSASNSPEFSQLAAQVSDLVAICTYGRGVPKVI